MLRPNIGISGFASYLPPHRVQLSQWCQWTGDQFDKIRTVVGNSFRMRGANENAYTMAATAVLRLIQQYDVDPSQIGFLGLGTESSTDNSAGAIIVKGMVNKALTEQGLAQIQRACEVQCAQDASGQKIKEIDAQEILEKSAALVKVQNSGVATGQLEFAAMVRRVDKLDASYNDL